MNRPEALFWVCLVAMLIGFGIVSAAPTRPTGYVVWLAGFVGWCWITNRMLKAG